MTADDDSSRFIHALERSDLAAVAQVPKTDLHSHSFFATQLGKVRAWSGVTIPAPPLRMHGLDGMQEYVREHLWPVILNRSGCEFTARSAVDDAVADRVAVLEMSFKASVIVHCYDHDASGFFDFITELKDSAALVLRPEVGVSWDDAIKPARLRLLGECIESGVFDGIDVWGDEVHFAPRAFQPIFRKAREGGMTAKAHVGEFGPATNVRWAVEQLELNAVQHGVTAVESEEELSWLADSNVVLNVCPESNVRLGVARCLDRHPIRALYDAGVAVTVNTDDLTLFGKTVSEQFLDLYQCGLFSARELDDIRTRSLRRYAP